MQRLNLYDSIKSVCSSSPAEDLKLPYFNQEGFHLALF